MPQPFKKEGDKRSIKFVIRFTNEEFGYLKTEFSKYPKHINVNGLGNFCRHRLFGYKIAKTTIPANYKLWVELFKCNTNIFQSMNYLTRKKFTEQDQEILKEIQKLFSEIRFKF